MCVIIEIESLTIAFTFVLFCLLNNFVFETGTTNEVLCSTAQTNASAHLEEDVTAIHEVRVAVAFRHSR
jgi:hypothetical protein